METPRCSNCAFYVAFIRLMSVTKSTIFILYGLEVLALKVWPALNLFQYEFPNPEWQNVSKDAKDLIRGMLETDPHKRLTIDDVIKNKWIAVSSYFAF